MMKHSHLHALHRRDWRLPVSLALLIGFGLALAVHFRLSGWFALLALAVIPACIYWVFSHYLDFSMPASGVLALIIHHWAVLAVASIQHTYSGRETLMMLWWALVYLLMCLVAIAYAAAIILHPLKQNRFLAPLLHRLGAPSFQSFDFAGESAPPLTVYEPEPLKAKSNAPIIRRVVVLAVLGFSLMGQYHYIQEIDTLKLLMYTEWRMPGYTSVVENIQTGAMIAEDGKVELPPKDAYLSFIGWVAVIQDGSLAFYISPLGEAYVRNTETRPTGWEFCDPSPRHPFWFHCYD